MSKLYFKYGAMGGGKTLDCIRTFFNYTEKGLKPIVYKSAFDSRTKNTIESRTGDSLECGLINASDNIVDIIKNNGKYDLSELNVVIIDESQFLSAKQIDDIKNVINLEYGIPVICYGLKNNFQSHLFEGSKRLLEIADKFEEIKSICWCGKLATQNARVVNGEIQLSGQEIEIGGNEMYVPLCYNHYIKGLYSPEKAKNN